MRLDDERESGNVEDRRGEPASVGGLGLPHLSVGTILVALVAGYFLHVNPLTILGLLSGGSAPAAVSDSARDSRPAAPDDMKRFVSKVLAETEDTWRDVFRETGRTYREPKLVLFTGATPTACGTGATAQGPFYCPGDEKVYIDLAFYQDLRDRFHAPGEFAEAYVIAHEVGHHVQNLLGIFERVEAAQRRAGDRESNALSVRLELQADCFAGVWGKRADTATHLLEPGEIEQALTAASAIGDDRLQTEARGYARPETFTHGSSAQRVHWFTEGIRSGDMSRCDTFGAGARP